MPNRNLRIYTTWFLVMLLVLLAYGGATLAAQKLKAGDVVWAEWKPNAWYHGKIARACSFGWYIKYDDGDEKCCRPDQVCKDQAPAPNQVQAGAAVLAEWSDGRYYPGTVEAIEGTVYKILYDDGDRREVGIEQIRLRF